MFLKSSLVKNVFYLQKPKVFNTEITENNILKM